MPANGFGQSIAGAKEIDRSGLAIILSENSGLRAYLGGQVVVDSPDFRRPFIPAELIGIDLRKRAQTMVLDTRRREMQRVRIADVSLDRKHWDS